MLTFFQTFGLTRLTSAILPTFAAVFLKFHKQAYGARRQEYFLEQNSPFYPEEQNPVINFNYCGNCFYGHAMEAYAAVKYRSQFTA